MRLTALAHRAAARRLATSVAIAALVGLALTGCASDDEDAGTPFTQALAKNYADLSTQAAALPAPQEEGGFFNSLDVFGLFSGGNPNQALVDGFKDKADSAAAGDEPAPEPAPADAAGQALGARLSRDLAGAKDQAPVPAARAQSDYDCWVMASAVPSAASMAQACRASLDASLAALEGGRPVAPLSAPVPAPIPAPVQSAPIAPVQAPVPAPAQAQAGGDFTVYFDFDSWTLTAEDLKVITDAINTARSGGQSHITVVGHTDTSGSADYNQRLSVRRANVVVEALVDMGARRAAITASGVGENDLAVQTGDEVKEAKNRRSVITLQP